MITVGTQGDPLLYCIFLMVSAPRRSLPKIDAMLDWGVVKEGDTIKAKGREDEGTLLANGNVLVDGKEKSMQVWLKEIYGNNTKLAEAGLPRGLLVGSIVRDGQVIIPHGQTLLNAKDQLVVFVHPDVINKVESIFPRKIMKTEKHGYFQLSI